MAGMHHGAVPHTCLENKPKHGQTMQHVQMQAVCMLLMTTGCCKSHLLAGQSSAGQWRQVQQAAETHRVAHRFLSGPFLSGASFMVSTDNQQSSVR